MTARNLALVALAVAAGWYALRRMPGRATAAPVGDRVAAPSAQPDFDPAVQFSDGRGGALI